MICYLQEEARNLELSTEIQKEATKKNIPEVNLSKTSYPFNAVGTLTFTRLGTDTVF